MDPVDLDNFRTKREDKAKTAKRQRLPRHKAGEHFLKGPIPVSWLSRAGSLSSRAVHVAMVLWYLAGLTGSCTVKPTHATWKLLGLSHDKGLRGLVELDGIGLVAVDRHPGRCPIVTILEPDRIRNT